MSNIAMLTKNIASLFFTHDKDLDLLDALAGSSWQGQFSSVAYSKYPISVMPGKLLNGNSHFVGTLQL